jgi:hypothetical protein
MLAQSSEAYDMPLWGQLIVAGIAAVGVIGVARAIIRGLAISRSPSHHLAEQSGTDPVPPEAQIPPSPG